MHRLFLLPLLFMELILASVAVMPQPSDKSDSATAVLDFEDGKQISVQIPECSRRPQGGAANW
jgi:hypothetical protein